MLNKFWALVMGALLLLSVPAMAGVEEAEGKLNVELAEVSSTVKGLKISRHYGGSVVDHIDEYAKLRDAGGKVEIVDFCISACTFTLSFIEPANLCAHPKALFGFHSASVQRTMMGPPEFAKEATRLLWNLYPAKVQETLKARGWDGDGDVEHPDIIYVKATDLVRACD